MKRKLLAVVLCIVTAGALFVSAGANEAKEEMTLSLQQAVDYALENSTAIKLSNTAVEKAEVGYSEAKKAIDKTEKQIEELTRQEKSAMGSQVLFENYKVTKGYYKELAGMGVTLAEAGSEQTIETVKMAVRSAYFDLLFAWEKVNIQKSMLDSARKDMDIANKKYELGMVSQVDVLASEAGLESARLSHQTAVRDAEYKLMSFNKTLGLPLKTLVSLTDSLDYTAPEETDIEAKVAEALENRYEILAAREQYRIDKMDFELTASWYLENTFANQKAKHQMESSQYKLVNAEQDVELSVRKTYMDMNSAYESIGVLAKNIERLEKAYHITKLRYDMGMSTSQEVVNALNALNDIKLQHLQAIHGYNLAKIQFEASSGIGIAVPGGF